MKTLITAIIMTVTTVVQQGRCRHQAKKVYPVTDLSEDCLVEVIRVIKAVRTTKWNLRIVTPSSV
jgi:hypothetical protein